MIWINNCHIKQTIKEKVFQWTIMLEDTYKKVNVNTYEIHKIVKIKRYLNKKKDLTKLMKEFIKIFTWTYEDMKKILLSVCFLQLYPLT